MSTRAAPWLAWPVCAVSLSILALSLVFIFLGWSKQVPEGWASWREQVISIVGFVGAPIVGGLVASHRPKNPYGWLWLGLGLSFALMQFGQTYATYALVTEPGSLPAPRTVVTLLGQGFVAAIIFIPFICLLFPDGHLPSRRWGLLAWLVVLVGVPLLILAPLVSDGGGMAPVKNPFGVGSNVAETVSALVDPGIMLLFVAIVLSAGSLVFRYRRATGIERQQIKWFAYAAVLNGCLITTDIIGLSDLLISHPFGYVVWTLLGTIASASLYAAVGIAILRYRLYDIDLLINRTLVYGSLTAMLVGVYFGGVVALQWVFVLLTGQSSTLAVVASTLLIAALFSPLRRRIQAFIDRRFYRRKYDARKTLESFSVKLRDQTDLEALNDDLVGVVRETMQPAYITLWLRSQTPKGE
jgi:hypothetical protein